MLYVGRREFMTLIGAAVAAAPAWPRLARAERRGPARRVGLLFLYVKGSPEGEGLLASFQDGMAKLGWTGDNVTYEHRWVGGNPLVMADPEQAARELVALRPDVILSSSSPGTAVLRELTRSTPIVFAQVVDPVGQGFVASLSRPGGNATGLVNLETSMAGKWIELLKDVVPGLARVAVPYHPSFAPYAEFYLKHFHSATASFGIQVVAERVADLAAFESFAAEQAKVAATGVIPMPSAFGSAHTREIAAIMLRHRLPAIYTIAPFAKAGGLLSYGNDIHDNYRRAANFVDRILKGEAPSELPVQFPVKFELVINLKTARILGLQVPQHLVATADEVIE